jgi:hypothetical protein
MSFKRGAIDENRRRFRSSNVSNVAVIKLVLVRGMSRVESFMAP